jgi:hypothetical protein
MKIFVGGKLMTIEEAQAEGWILDSDLELLKRWGYYEPGTSEKRSESIRAKVRSNSKVLSKSGVPRVGTSKRRKSNP